jgi:3beta-hydroxysteroid-4beta-carboxylate 3-dehydrogenase (decarboxylating)
MILVTGANGHLGGNLVRRLLQDGQSVRVLVRQKTKNVAIEGLSVDRVYGDLLDLPSVVSAVRGCKRIYHCAALVSIGRARLRELYDNNVTATRHLLQAAKEAGVSRVVATGSVEALTFDPPKPINESVGLYPFGKPMPYSLAKAFAEHECLKAAVEGLDVVIVVPTGIIGPNDFKPSPMGKVLIDFAHRKMPAYIPGGADFTAMKDIVEGHILAMEKGRAGQKYIFSTEFLTMDRVMSMFAEVTGVAPPRLKLPPGLMMGMAEVVSFFATRFSPGTELPLTPDAVRIVRMQRKVDCSKAKNELGFQPTSMKHAIQDAYDCFVRRGVIKLPRKRVHA